MGTGDPGSPGKLSSKCTQVDNANKSTSAYLQVPSPWLLLSAEKIPDLFH